MQGDQFPNLGSSGFYGQSTVATGGNPEQLTTTKQELENGVLIAPLSSNTGVVYVGFDDSVSSSNGYELESGDEPIFIPIDRLDKIYLDVGTNGEGISYIGT